MVCATLLLALSWGLHPPGRAEAANPAACRRACLTDYRECVASGQFGCDDLFAQCVSGCGPSAEAAPEPAWPAVRETERCEKSQAAARGPDSVRCNIIFFCTPDVFIRCGDKTICPCEC